MKLHLDIETGSRCNLKTEGLYRYAQHASTFVRVVCYAFDEEPGTIWVPLDALPAEIFVKLRLRLKQNEELICSEQIPARVKMHIEMGGEVRAHNAAFERNVLSGPAGKKIGFPEIKIMQTVCVMAKAAAHNMPEDLGDLCASLGSYPKDEGGRNDMMYLSKPRQNGTFCSPFEEPDRFVRLYSYCMDDVYAERGADESLPDLSPSEQIYYWMDQRINDRGWLADVESVKNAHALALAYKAEIREEIVRLTGYTPGQTGKLAEWCRDEGYFTLPDLQAETVVTACEDPSCPPHVKRVLQLYSTHNMKAVSKFPAILRSKCDDDVLRGMFRYHAAGPGRWSSRIVQLHNLFRPKIKDQDTAIEAFRQRNLQFLRALYDGEVDAKGRPINPMVVLASCVRGMLTARPGKILIFPDFSGIEARFNAWAWNEEWKLLAYRAYDTIVTDDRGHVVFDKKGEPMRAGPDLYVLAYARAFGVAIEDVTKDMRQIGKVMELALGYEGGVGAFVTMVDTYGLDLEALAEAAYPTIPLDVMLEAADGWEWALKNKRSTHGLSKRTWMIIDALKRMWRRAHPRIVTGWKSLKECAENAVANPGQVFRFANGKGAFKVNDRWLYMRLPSGRNLAYYRPRLADDGTIRYMGTDTFTRRWGWTSSYGGKWDENFVQGGCACILREALLTGEEHGYTPIGHVHDEPVTEVDESFGSVDELGRLICAPRKWRETLPLAYEGHRAKRYRK